MGGFGGEWLVGLVASLAVLYLVGRGLPLRRWVPVLAFTLAVVIAIVLVEQNGLWPGGWRLGR